MELADTSAWSWSRRAGSTRLRADFDARTVRGEIATCAMVALELLYSARHAGHLDRIAQGLSALPSCPIPEHAWERALWVYRELAGEGGAHQRAVGHADLVIAATAELAAVPVLHYDEDYERIAQVTGQPTRWLAPPGSLR